MPIQAAQMRRLPHIRTNLYLNNSSRTILQSTEYYGVIYIMAFQISGQQTNSFRIPQSIVIPAEQVG